jgi:AraC family transcriptional regulator, transcriptional activator FtrA
MQLSWLGRVVLWPSATSRSARSTGPAWGPGSSGQRRRPGWLGAVGPRSAGPRDFEIRFALIKTGGLALLIASPFALVYLIDHVGTSGQRAGILGGPTVAALLQDDILGLELGIITSIFGSPLPGLTTSWYKLSLCAEQPKPISIAGGATIQARHDLDRLVSADTIIVPSGDLSRSVSDAVSDALRTAHLRGARVVSLCTGVFDVAAAGILDGRRATTHWSVANLLAEMYPRVKIDPSVLYVDDQNIYTCSGGGAALDMCVHIVRRDFGSTVANALARQLVLSAHRESYQPQLVETLVWADPMDDGVAASMAWALKNLDKTITVEGLAKKARMSTRNFLRQFSRQAGTSPIRWLILQRVRASLPLLKSTTLPVEQVASRVGFERSVTYRSHFRKIVGQAPNSYRREFGRQFGISTAERPADVPGTGP